MKPVDSGPRPPLVIVSGAPGSGKTTLASELGPALGLPVFSKDSFKEALFDVLGAADAEAGQRLGRASLLLLRDVAAQLLAAHTGVLLEANLRRRLAHEITGPLLPLARTVLVHCEGDPQEILRRYRQRDESGARHAAHGDPTAYARLEAQLIAGDYEPLDLGAPLIRVTTTGSGPRRPELDAIVHLIRDSAGMAGSS